MTDDEIVALLQKDIRRASDSGIPIDMDWVGVWSINGVYATAQAPMNCRVCAIGAALLGKPATHGSYFEDFGLQMGRSLHWSEGFMDGSDYEGRVSERRPRLRGNIGTIHFDEGYALARKIVAWVVTEQAAGRLKKLD